MEIMEMNYLIILTFFGVFVNDGVDDKSLFNVSQSQTSYSPSEITRLVRELEARAIVCEGRSLVRRQWIGNLPGMESNAKENQHIRREYTSSTAIYVLAIKAYTVTCSIVDNI